MTLPVEYLKTIVNVQWANPLAIILNVGTTNGAHALGYQPSPIITVRNGSIVRPDNGAPGLQRVSGAGFTIDGGNFEDVDFGATSVSVVLGKSPDIFSTWTRTLGVFTFAGTENDLTAALSVFNDANGPGGSGHSSGWIGSFVVTSEGGGVIHCSSGVQYKQGATLTTQPGADGFDGVASSGWSKVDTFGSTYDFPLLTMVTGAIVLRGGFFHAKNPTSKSPFSLGASPPPPTPTQLLEQFPSLPDGSKHSDPPTKKLLFNFADNPGMVNKINTKGSLFP